MAETPDRAVLGRRIGRTEYMDRCIGSLLACACGDILGANLESKSRTEIDREHGRVDSFIGSSWRPLGMYTDDTEMTLALATSIVGCGRLDAEHCAAAYASFFELEPRRGYSPATTQILEMLRDGVDYRTTGTAIHSSGSYGNGGAMRIAPIGLAFRNAADSVLREAVRLALFSTHVHREAVDAAFVQAKGVAIMANAVYADDLDALHLLGQLRNVAQTAAMQEKLNVVLFACRENWTPETVLERVCALDQDGKYFQIRATDAVACVLWALANSWRSPEQCIIEAVGLGGDTDTLGAMVGALVGALHGTAWLPTRWYENMENEGNVGRDRIIATAAKLAHLDLHSVAA